MFCLGIIFSSILVAIFQWSFLISPIWIWLAILLLVYAYFYPARAFLVLSFLAGVIIGYARATSILKNGANEIDQWSFVVQTRDWFAARISSLVPEPESKLGLAYLLGIKDALPKDLNNNLKAVGLAHIVVASGTHLSILVDVAKKLFGKISRFAGLLFSIIFIVLFMVMVGWTPSILRAGIVSILSISMWYVGRKFEPWRIILLAMTITILINPTFLTNLGWLLSFASFGGILILSPAIQKFFYGEQKPNFLASAIITTISATLATLPITLFYFGSISLISLVANLLILPTLPYVMGLTFFTGFFAGAPLIQDVLGFLTTKSLDFHIMIVNFFASQTFFIIEIPTGNPWIFLLYVPIFLPFLVNSCSF